MKKHVIVILIVLCGLNAFSQDSGASAIKDTGQRPAIRKHTFQKPAKVRRDSIFPQNSSVISDSLNYKNVSVSAVNTRPTISVFTLKMDTPFFAHHPYFRFTDPIRYSVAIKKWMGKEPLFYSIITLLIFFALVKNSFPRYMTDLFKTFFQTTIKQKQTREQLLQNPLPSLLLNLFFTLSTGMFLALLFQYFKLGMEFNFWLLYLYCVLGLIGIYVLKFVSLKFLGWIFQVAEATDSYIFIVFTANKIIGIVLLPLLVVLSLAYGGVSQAAISLSVMVVMALLAYRFLLSFVLIRNQIHISFFHFLIYLCAFEIIPLLLINKVLFRFFGETP